MGVSRSDPDRPRLNERLDHLQARHPYRYNLGTGAVMGLVLFLIGFHPILAVAFVVSWALLRGFLWGDGRILRRQYEARVVRVAAEAEERRRHR
jgi:hypothetical protein